jgi:hypothetical protein
MMTGCRLVVNENWFVTGMEKGGKVGGSLDIYTSWQPISDCENQNTLSPIGRPVDAW